MSSLIEDAINTQLCGGSTENPVEKSQDCVEFVLDQKKRRWYRRNMTKKPSHGLRGIRPEHLRAAWLIAKRERDVSQGDIAHAVGCDQQTISRLMHVGADRKKGTEEGGWKWPVIRFLANELWQVATEKNALNLFKELRALGLQPKSDNDMTIAGTVQDTAGPEYSFNLYEPWLARGDTMLTFPSAPSAKIRPPTQVHSPKAYAFRMIGDMMRPVFRSGQILDVDPEVEPQIGDNCVFYTATRGRVRVGELVSVSAHSWHIVTRPETRFQEGHDLSFDEWPTCEVIIGARRA